MSAPNLKLTAARLAVAKSPNSKATALRYYIKEHVGLLHNPVTADLRAEFAAALAAVKGRNAPTVVDICRDCVGGVEKGHCRDSIRKCDITNCLLFNVRPYQLKSKVSPQNASPRAFLGTNASEVIGHPTPITNTSKKWPPQHMASHYFSMGVK